jgi:flagella basal body P-ring formation protein FlgA
MTTLLAALVLAFAPSAPLAQSSPAPDVSKPAPADGPDALVVALTAKVEVHHTPVLLEDVAQLAGPTADVARARKIALCPAPALGKPRLVTSAGVRLAARLAGVEILAGQVVGAPQAEIVANWHELAADDVVAAALQWITAQTETMGDRVLFERVTAPDAVALLEGAGDAAFQCAFVGRPRRAGVVQVKVSVLQETTLVGERVVNFRVRRFGRQLRLVTNVKRGEPVVAAQTLVMDGEWTAVNGTPVVDPKDVAGMVASRDLEAGAVLVKESFEQPVLVDRGGSVRMVLESGGLRIVALGVAQRSGRRGEVIPVTNPSTEKVMQAELIERGASGEVVARVR